MKSTGPDSDPLLHALRVLRENWWLLLLGLVLGATAGLGLAARADDTYEATSRVLFGGGQVTDQVFNIDRRSAQPERDAATAVVLATSEEVADRVAAQIGGNRDDLLADLTVEAEENADVLAITAEASTPRQAARVANAFADAFVAFRREAERDQLDASIDALGAQAEALPNRSEQARELFRQRAQLAALRSATTGGAQRLGEALPPTSRSSPNPRRDAIIGSILGLVVALTAAFVLDLFDRRVKDAEEFEALYGAKALATVPQEAFNESRELTARAAAFEPYRMLRNALGFAELAHEVRAIMVTSAMAGEGKTTVAVNLARAIALSGQAVALVECDLRRPNLARQLDLDRDGGGLTTALVGRQPVRSLLQMPQAGVRHFAVLPSGPLPPNAAELLRSPQMGRLLEELAGDGRMIILDAPPLLPVADAHGLLLLPQVDAVLIVARAYQTTRDEARRARAILDQHRLEPLGLVVTGLRERADYGYYGELPAEATGNGSGRARARRKGEVQT